MDDLKLIMEARRLIDMDQPLSRAHLLALRPMYKILEHKLKPKDPTPFLGNLSAGFIVCATPFEKLKGIAFIHQLLGQATNQIEESRSISSASLYSCGIMGKKGFMLYDDEPGVFDSDDESETSLLQGAKWDEECSKEMLDVMETDRKKLENAGETPETNELLAFYVKQLGDRRFLRKSKPFDNDPENMRKNVEAAIRYAIDKLIECEDTKHVGYHLKDTIITGIDCVYVGDWRWKLF